MNFILCGPPKTGKTTIGKWLAPKCALAFVDLDKVMEELFHIRTGQHLTNRQIYQRYGENYFRELEYQALLTLKDQKQCLIATGAGCVCYDLSYKLLPELGKVIYLHSPLEVIYERMQTTSFPATMDKIDPMASLKKMLALRIPLYENIADLIVKTAHYSQEELIKHLCQYIHTYKGS